MPKIKEKVRINNIKLGVKKMYPELEELEVTPTLNKNIYVPAKYGFEKVTVNKIEAEDIRIATSRQEQEFTGIYKNIVVDPYRPKLQEKTVTPKDTKQVIVADPSFDGLSRVNVEKAPEPEPPVTEELVITPSEEEQVFTGLFDKVTCEGAELQGDIKLPVEIPLNLGDYTQISVAGNNEIILLDSKTAIISVAEEDKLKVNKIVITELNYIEFTGTQYINTGLDVFNNDSFSIELDLAITSFLNDKTPIVGTLEGSTNYQLNYTIDKKLHSKLASSTMYRGTLVENEKTNIVFEYGSYHYVKVNGVAGSGQGSNYKSNKTTSPLTLFYRGTVGYLGLAKLYGAKIYVSGNLIADYIPILDGDNVPCLYDKVSENYLYNSGTGNFLYG